MPAELSVPALIVINAVAWPVIQLGLARAGERIPSRWLSPDSAVFRIRDGESGGRLYERLFRIRRWKDLLPDGTRITGRGFSKSRLQRRDRAYLTTFRQEACRGELVHWAALLTTPLFLLWNPVWVMPVHAAYALAANLPCILVQRYNRARLGRVLPVDRSARP